MSRHPHVLILVENVPFGRDTRVRKQVESLLAHGYEVSIVSPRSPVNEPFRDRPRLHVFEYAPPPTGSSASAYVLEYAYSIVMAAARAGRARLARRVDVVQLCQPPDAYVVLAWGLRMAGARIVVDQRDLLTELYGARYGDRHPSVRRALGWLERLSQRTADHVLVVNPTLRQRALAAGVPAERVTIVRNGPVLSAVDAATAEPSLRDGKRFLVCWTGVMGRQDRVDLVIEAIGHVVHGLGRTDCRFAIVGDGETGDEVRAAASARGLCEWVDFPGWVDEATLFRYLATADLGLDASLQAEVSPVKAAEYMAFGLPFVAFDLPETRRTGGDAALYVPPGDVAALGSTLDSILRDDRQREAMGRCARKRAETDLVWDRQEPTYLAAFNDLVEPSRETRSALPS